MKEFEKWLKEHSEKTGYLTGPDWYKQRKMGWKAALELVMSTFNLNLAATDNKDIINVYDMIKKELGDNQ